MGELTSKNIQLSKAQTAQIEETARWASALAGAVQSPMQELARRISESARYSLVGIFHEIHERNLETSRKLMQQIASSFVIQLPTIDLYSGIGTPTEAYEAEIVSDNEMNMKRVSFPVKRERSALSLTMLAGGSFRYKRSILKGIAAKKSNPGRLLALFLQHETYFVADDDIITKLYLTDKRDVGYVLRDLKNKFRKNKLVIDVERRCSPDGYQILEIKRIQ